MVGVDNEPLLTYEDTWDSIYQLLYPDYITYPFMGFLITFEPEVQQNSSPNNQHTKYDVQLM
jgi:hypothetical protein